MTELARIIDGVVVERIQSEALESRTLPPEWYTPVQAELHPGLLPGKDVSEITSVIDGVLHVRYVVTDLTVGAILALMNSVRSGDYYDQTLAALWLRAETLVEDKLNAWAQSRGYNDIDRLVSYASSKDVQRSIEGQRGVDQRDALYDAYYAYVEQVKAGTQPIPKAISDILKHIPDPVWTV